MAIAQERVLIVDDEAAVRVSLSEWLEQAGFRVVGAETVEQARRAFTTGVDCVVLDYRLPDGSGFELLREMKTLDRGVPIVMMTALSSVEHAVQAMSDGAFHYLAKPAELDEVERVVRRGLEVTRLRRHGKAGDRETGDPIVGRSPAIKALRALVARIATSPASTVLVTGESGTGKDLIAHSIHEHSSRSSGPLVNVNCSALPAALLESELFGHERGAFTDAKQRKLGLIEHARGGTTFLDEIGEMDPAVQAKLLRLLESKRFRRVGGIEDIDADTRIVAATNVDLRAAVEAGAFREDLYYRLAVLVIEVPPLRDREGDAELLADHFVARFNEEFGKSVSRFAPSALELIRSYSWPGNVRELKNAIERAVLLADGDVLTVADLELHRSSEPSTAGFSLPIGGVNIRDVERHLVEQALERAAGNRTHAAKLLGMSRDQIRYRIELYELADEERD